MEPRTPVTGAAPINYSLKSEVIHYDSLSIIFNSLHSNTNQDLVEKHLCNQGSHYEIGMHQYTILISVSAIFGSIESVSVIV